NRASPPFFAPSYISASSNQAPLSIFGPPNQASSLISASSNQAPSPITAPSNEGMVVPINRYFLNDPEMVLGSWTRKDTLYGGEGYSVVGNGDLVGQLKAAI